VPLTPKGDFMQKKTVEILAEITEELIQKRKYHETELKQVKKVLDAIQIINI